MRNGGGLMFMREQRIREEKGHEYQKKKKSKVVF